MGIIMNVMTDLFKKIGKTKRIVVHKKCLVLNADYSCIGLTSWENAVSAQYKDQVNVVDIYTGEKIKSADGSYWPVAAVMCCKEYQHHLKKVPFSRKNVFIRDRLICQYCGQKFHFSKLTFDHVVPRSKHRDPKNKTPTHWENIVTCCYPCNHKKGPYTLQECEMTLIRKPFEPKPFGYVKGISPWTIIRKEWVQWLPKYYLDICSVES